MIEFSRIRAVIYDMDGLLVDTEPLWRKAEIKVFSRVGVVLTEEMTHQTTGLRVDEVVQYWHARFPWTGETLDAVAEAILEEVTGLILREGELLPGVTESLDMVKAAGLKVALASSSPHRLISAVIDHFDLRRYFEVVESAESEPYGKPHPAVFLNSARKLGVEPECCLVFEDSVNGMVAAKAAKMSCVVVPALENWEDPRFSLADLKLKSLHEFEWGRF